MLLDYKLTWTPHLEEKMTACKKLMVIINSKLRGLQAPKPNLSKWAYTGVIRPKLLYGSIAWGNSCNTTKISKAMKAMKALDRLCTKSITITKNTPQASIEIITDLMPIELIIQKQAYLHT